MSIRDIMTSVRLQFGLIPRALAEGKEMVVQTAGQSTSSEMRRRRTPLPDVAFVQAANNLIYET